MEITPAAIAGMTPDELTAMMREHAAQMKWQLRNLSTSR
jgi:hypothetical protein